MAERESVNVWFDNPGGFLEIFWGYDDGSGNVVDPDTKLNPTIFIDSKDRVAGFHIIGALNDRTGSVEETYTFDDSPSHPLTVKYDKTKDLWDVHWGHAAVDCVATPNQRIRAKVDAEGLIQGVQISDLRGFKDEILNQDLYPVKPGAPTA